MFQQIGDSLEQTDAAGPFSLRRTEHRVSRILRLCDSSRHHKLGERVGFPIKLTYAELTPRAAMRRVTRRVRVGGDGTGALRNLWVGSNQRRST